MKIDLEAIGQEMRVTDILLALGDRFSELASAGESGQITPTDALIQETLAINKALEGICQVFRAEAPSASTKL